MTRRYMGVHMLSSILLSSRIGKDESAEAKRRREKQRRGVERGKVLGRGGEAGRGGEVMVGWWGVTENAGHWQ